MKEINFKCYIKKLYSSKGPYNGATLCQENINEQPDVVFASAHVNLGTDSHTVIHSVNLTE